MSGESGRFVTVNNVGSLGSVSINETLSAESYVSSNTGGGTVSGGGVVDWSASLAGMGGKPPLFPNDIFQLQAYMYPTTGVEGTDGLRYEGEVIVQQITIVWNHVNNQLTKWTAQLAGRSSLSKQNGAPFVDTTALSSDYPCGTFPKVGAVEIPAITTSTLTISANLSEANNSSTRDAGGCFIKRSPGPINWTWQATNEDFLRGAAAGYPDLNALTELELPINDTESWKLKWGRWLAYSNLNGNTDGTNITRQINVAMVANNGTGLGYIIKPGETDAAWGTV